ncbi:MAG: hypothetical protein K2H76_02115 [Muribaculaceae bacterium]|nr:hypothetical protein [Muribaculaceae bacterium]
MKQPFFKVFALIMGMVMTTALTACGNDDDEPQNPQAPKEVASYEMTYMAEVTDGYLDYYDVTLSYVDSQGATKTEALTSKKSFSVTVPANAMPSEVGLTIHATVKNPLPNYDEETVYTFGCTYQLVVNRVFTDKSTELAGGDIIPNTHTLSVKGDKLSNYFDKHADFDIASTTVSLH